MIVYYAGKYFLTNTHLNDEQEVLEECKCLQEVNGAAHVGDN